MSTLDREGQYMRHMLVPKSHRKDTAITTVGELKQWLADLPDDLAVGGDALFDGRVVAAAVTMVWRGHDAVMFDAVMFEECDAEDLNQ